MLLILVAILALIVVYWLIVKPQAYWRSKGVPPVFNIPIVTDIWNLIKGDHLTVNIDNQYNTYPNARYFGSYTFGHPTLVIRDPELIKLLGVKDFDHFVDHRTVIPEDVDPLWSKNLVSLTGQRWRDMRATLSPSFTSSKMRAMFVLMTQTAKSFVKHFSEKNEKVVELEFKDAFTRFTNDVIANTVFGVECNSLEDKENEFYIMTKKATNFKSFWRNLKLMIVFFVPKVANIFKLKWMDSDVTSFFRRVVKDNMDYRTKHNIVRPDVINLLMEARSGKNHSIKHEEIKDDASFAAVEEHIESKEINAKELTDDEITSQALIFFFAGFETVSTAMCFLGYELAVNPDIQAKLIEEIDNNQQRHGDLTYEALTKMTYLDMVLTESLRKWPAAVMTDRVCTKSYTIQPVTPEEQPVSLKPKEQIIIPIWSLHRDPNHYEDPEKFNPERFSPENRHRIDPYTYLPFGVGPRNCIGSRFALLEAKAVLYYILLNFEIVPTGKSTIPIQLAKRNMNMVAENGFWFGLKKRNKA